MKRFERIIGRPSDDRLKSKFEYPTDATEFEVPSFLPGANTVQDPLQTNNDRAAATVIAATARAIAAIAVTAALIDIAIALAVVRARHPRVRHLGLNTAASLTTSPDTSMATNQEFSPPLGCEAPRDTHLRMPMEGVGPYHSYP